MDKYSKILVISDNSRYIDKIKEIGFTNSTMISPRILRDEITSIDYITQFTPDVIVVDDCKDKLNYIKMAADIVDAKLFDNDINDIIKYIE